MQDRTIAAKLRTAGYKVNTLKGESGTIMKVIDRESGKTIGNFINGMASNDALSEKINKVVNAGKAKRKFNYQTKDRVRREG